MMMKEKFVAFKASWTKTWKIYENDGKGYFTDSEGNGFSYQKIQSNGRFILGNTEEAVRKEIKTKEFRSTYPELDGNEGNVTCPGCGYRFDLLGYWDENDGFYCPGINEDWSKKINCLCGVSFVASVKKVTVEMEVKII